VIAQITLDPSGRMLLGTEPLSAAALIAACGADVMGLNCSTGPARWWIRCGRWPSTRRFRSPASRTPASRKIAKACGISAAAG